MIPVKLFQQITILLEKVEIPYMLTGCCANNYHGAPRGTPDIDFLIAANAAQITSFVKLLSVREYEFDLPSAVLAAQEQSMFTVINNLSGWKIDFVLHKPSGFDDQRLRRRARVEVEGVHLFIESPEDLLLSQLRWTKNGESFRHIEDAAGILKVSGDVLDFDYIQQWVEKLEIETQWSAARKLAVLPGAPVHDIL